jgi:YidC/Oxa1 family membrane protein insertase
MFANIFQPLISVAESILRFFHDSLGFSWGFAIVGLTVCVRTAILPLTFKQVRSMQAMQRLQPQMKELQKRYKEDRQRMNQELMKLYQEHQVNPLGSCLPLVLQLPFFMALFYTLQSSSFKADVRATGQEAFFFIPDITQKATGAVLVTLILIYIGTQLGSSMVSAMAMTDKNQKRLIFALPFVFTPFIVSFPAGLLVYWITTNTWTIGQQLVIRKLLPPPHLADTVDEGEKKAAKPLGRLARALAGGEGKAEEIIAGGHKDAASDGGKSDTGGSGGRKKRGATTDDGKKPATGGGRKRTGAAKAGKEAGGKGSTASGDANNGGPHKAPPPSPRKKKKRSGRRR